MARFDLYGPTAGDLLLDVQSEILDRLDTRVVVPLTPLGRSTVPAGQLNPHFDIGGERHILQSQWLASVPKARLGRQVANLTGHWDEIARALDMLFTGF